MLSEHSLSIAGWAFTWTDRDILLAGVSVIVGLVVGAILFFPRKRIKLQRSSATDQFALDLSRIADALERIANRPAARAIAAAARREQSASSGSGIPLSMFGR
jgi:hypothetical protein